LDGAIDWQISRGMTLKSKNFSNTFVKEKLEQRQASQFFYSVGRKKYLSPLAVGHSVRVQVKKKRIPGIIRLCLCVQNQTLTLCQQIVVACFVVIGKQST
jgi:hypothetical protein